jgi:alkyl hydroperoxide reductase subunit F
MLDANLQSQLKTYLERVTRPIQITAHADDGAKSQEMLELLQTLESLSDKISLRCCATARAACRPSTWARRARTST